MDSKTERDLLVLFASLADKAERYDDVLEAMKSVVKLGGELTESERNLMSLGLKNAIGARRNAWRVLTSFGQKEESMGHENNMKMIRNYRKKVEDELTKLCTDVLSIIDSHLLPSSTAGESTVFYHKMKGDFFRYLAECKFGAVWKDVLDQSIEAYETATVIATSDLPPTNPIRLGLALNYSVLYYEIMHCRERACSIAKAAFNDAAEELEKLDEEQYRNTNVIMKLIKDNLELWAETAEEGESSENRKVGDSSENHKSGDSSENRKAGEP